MTYWNEHKLYCPKGMSERAVLDMYEDIEITRWGRVHQITTARSLNPTTNNAKDNTNNANDNTNNANYDNTNNANANTNNVNANTNNVVE